MIKQLLRYIVFLVPLPLTAQSSDILVTKHIFKFADVEKQVPEQTINAFIAQTKSSFPAYADTTIAMHTTDELYSHLHFMDINGDGRDDVIFEGQDTGEGHIITLFINKGKSYKKVFEDKQGITNMAFKSKRLSTLQVGDWGCCGAYLNFKKTYTVSFDDKYNPAFALVKQTAAVFDGVGPDSLLVKPFTKSVVEYNVHLRSTPTVDDSSYAPWQVDNIPRGSGNTIGFLSKNVTCTVIGKKTGINHW
jgi:hypothetical protein